MVKYCRTCGYGKDFHFQDGRPACAFHKIAIDLGKDFCSWHNVDPPKCGICGNIILPGQESFIIDTTTYCVNCYNRRK